MQYWAWSRPEDPYLTKLRTDYHLSELVADKPDNYARVQVVTRWVHGLWEHDGEYVPATRDPLTIIEAATASPVEGGRRRRPAAGVARRYPFRPFAECDAEKNCTLIRYDILQGLRRLYDAVQDEAIRAKALGLIATEPDLKYRKKYATLWK